MNRIDLVFLILFISNISNAQCTLLTTFKTDTYGGPSVPLKSVNKLFFSAYDDIHGRELWCTDGTKAGTYLVKDINPGINNSIEDYFELTSYDLNGIIYFRGNDGVTGTELWRSDGTVSGTYLVKDLYVGNVNSAIGYFTSVNNILYFTTNGGTALWRSDGTTNGTFSIRSFTIITNLYGFNGLLYFAADDVNNGQELWKSNGTVGGTVLLKDLNGVPGASLPCNFHATNNKLYFTATTNDGWELWSTTGTYSSTQQVKDINPGGNNGVLDFYSEVNMADIGDTLYFRANDGVNGYQLWRSDGSDSGTVRLTNLLNGVDSYSLFPVVDGKVMINNYALSNFWQYDPQTDSAVVTNYPLNSFYNNSMRKFLFIGTQLCFVDRDSIYGCEIWESDGTPGGRRLIQETHLTDNWNTAFTQGFNTLFGALGNELLFTLARTAYNTEIPLYSYTAGSALNCYPPSVIVPVPLADTAAHFVWNRTQNTTGYEFRFRSVGSGNWNTIATNQSFCGIYNLISASDYEYQLRSYCNGSWTNWSDLTVYNSSFTQNDYIVSILAEKSESGTVERIYWLPTPQITNLQFRYRIYGTNSWSYAYNSNGYKRLTGLIPDTFYEYQYRAFIGGVWDQWYAFYRYFVTASNITTAVSPSEKNPERIQAIPNPSSGKIELIGIQNEMADLILIDSRGKIILEKQLTDSFLDVGTLNAGIYFLKITIKGEVHLIRIMREGTAKCD